jgi:ABC-2 type transport system ATP-binding protein
MRALVRDLPNRHGVTVFLSSHLLSEVEQIATHVAILSKGQIQFEGTPQELKVQSQSIVIEVDQLERARVLLESAGCVTRGEGSRMVVQSQSMIGPAEINAMLVQARIAVSHLAVQAATLEDMFLQITRDVPEDCEVSR